MRIGGCGEDVVNLQVIAASLSTSY